MVLKEIYAIPEGETRYKEGVLELDNPLDCLIQQIDLLLFTNKGEVLLMPEFGCNLEEYLFETFYNDETIKNVIMDQIRTYILNPYGYSIDVKVSFVEWDLNIAMIVDIYINGNKTTSYVV